MSARNMVLILMFGGLFYGGYRLYRSHTIQPLEASLITIDTSQISQLRLHQPDRQQRIIQLQREGDNWIASDGQVHLRALQRPVANILRNLVDITTVDIAAKEEADWQHYGLSPGQSVRVEIYQDQALVKNFWIGYTQPDTGGVDSISFIRIDQEQEVYTIRGLQAWPFYQHFSRFRPKGMLSLSAGSTIDSFVFQLPDTSFSFHRQDQDWVMNGSVVSDPRRIEKYLGGLRKVESTNFVDDYDYNRPESHKYGSLLLHTPGSEQPILIHAYVDTLREAPFILHCSQHPTAWFGSDSSGLYQRFFGMLDSLLSPVAAPVNDL